MIGNDNRVRMCDFGISSKAKTHFLKTNIGTNVFKAPEVLKQNYDQKCDIWSLACLLYNMVTADYAFDSYNGIGLMIK
jgi:serine/threonine protein kinase